MVGIPQLGGHKDILTLAYTTCNSSFDALTDLLLVAIVTGTRVRISMQQEALC
jgi:hypothetical protein